ncbi:MAG: hypothetical protein ACOYYS_19795 [Chloroflexota bacterium]
MTPEEKQEWLACSNSPLYFLHHYGYVYDAVARDWIPFRLWPAQARTLLTLLNNLLVVILKARQLGLTWLVLGFALWLMVFHPAATVLLFSRRETEAINLLTERMKGMYNRLPAWMRCRAVLVDNDHEFRLSNGSAAMAFPTTAGDSYSATLVIVDEADLVPDLNFLMRAVKPTIDAGGHMVLLSRANKETPNSEFKNIYLAAKKQLSNWVSVFLPWYARPDRDKAWYREQKADILSRTRSLDDLYEQYPATDAQALAPKMLGKRLPFKWINSCYDERMPIDAPVEKTPAIPGLEIYAEKRFGRRYVIGADPAEGNPTSDDSALEVLDADSGEEVAALAGQFEPSTFGAYIDEIGRYFSNAGVLVERNNHGHAVLLWLSEHSALNILTGLDGRPGWLNNHKGKSQMYSYTADSLRDKQALIHSIDTQSQLASIEGASLSAPEGDRDDRATAFSLAVTATQLHPGSAGGSFSASYT